MFSRMLARATLLVGACFSFVAHAESTGAAPFNSNAVRPAAAAGLYQCKGPSGGTVFRASPREDCVLLASPDPGAPDPRRWVPLMGGNGVVSYLDQESIRRRGTEVGVALVHNAPPGVIKTASGDTIRSSLKRMVFNCATSMYAVIEQTLYNKRYARGESLYTIRGPQAGMPMPAASGTLAGDLVTRLCH
ncbi:surface-adhesin E family protein [Cupriavidus sp. DL-D2]|uniref:surface-adhesin E family protein n=1 Tax=Cupriavidus sp. DL-D2 TaxID=3144974 RepID=UPI003212C182